MRVGYIRVSSLSQTYDRQHYIIGESDKIFEEKITAKDAERPELIKMLDFVREGDTVVITSIDRIARSTKDLLEIVERLKNKGVIFESKKENIDTNTPNGKFVLTIFGALAELERDMIHERCMEGIAAAKAAGKHMGRPRVKIEGWHETYHEWCNGRISATAACKKLGISRTVFYRRVNEEKAQQSKNELGDE